MFVWKWKLHAWVKNFRNKLLGYLLSEPVSKDRKYYTTLEDKRSCCLLFMWKIRFIITQKRISSNDFFLIKVKYCGIHINIRTLVTYNISLAARRRSRTESNITVGRAQYPGIRQLNQYIYSHSYWILQTCDPSNKVQLIYWRNYKY